MEQGRPAEARRGDRSVVLRPWQVGTGGVESAGVVGGVPWDSGAREPQLIAERADAAYTGRTGEDDDGIPMPQLGPGYRHWFARVSSGSACNLALAQAQDDDLPPTQADPTQDDCVTAQGLSIQAAAAAAGDCGDDDDDGGGDDGDDDDGDDDDGEDDEDDMMTVMNPVCARFS